MLTYEWLWQWVYLVMSVIGTLCDTIQGHSSQLIQVRKGLFSDLLVRINF
jgi:hypothetical protein